MIEDEEELPEWPSCDGGVSSMMPTAPLPDNGELLTPDVIASIESHGWSFCSQNSYHAWFERPDIGTGLTLSKSGNSASGGASIQPEPFKFGTSVRYETPAPEFRGCGSHKRSFEWALGLYRENVLFLLELGFNLGSVEAVRYVGSGAGGIVSNYRFYDWELGRALDGERS